MLKENEKKRRKAFNIFKRPCCNSIVCVCVCVYIYMYVYIYIYILYT